MIFKKIIFQIKNKRNLIMKKLLIILVVLFSSVFSQWTITDYYGIDSLGYGVGWRYYNHQLNLQFRTGRPDGTPRVKYEKYVGQKALVNGDEVIIRCQVIGGSVHALVELYDNLNPSVASNVVTLSATGNYGNYNFILPAGAINFNRIRILWGYFPYEYGTRTILIDSIYTKNGVSIENPYWFTPTGVEEEGLKLSEFSLNQNYPNPFNPETNISFNLPTNEFVNVVVYNQIGQEVAVLASGEFLAGKHSLKFDAHQLPSGIYFCKVTAGTVKKTLKMILLK